MALIDNPQVYDEKIPTNVRIEERLKQKIYWEVEKTGKTISDIVNESLRKHYNMGEE